MQKKILITVAIQVLNEAVNLRRCLKQLGRFTEIVLIDSGSTDETIAIAEEFGATVIRFKWDGKFPKKRNWLLRNHAPTTPWVLFLDTDEVIGDIFCKKLQENLTTTSHNGFWITYENLMGKSLKFRTPNKKLALFKVGTGEYEQTNEDQWGPLDMEIYEQPIRSETTGEIIRRIEYFDQRRVKDCLPNNIEYAIWETQRWRQLQSGQSPHNLSTKLGFKYRYLDQT